MTVVLARVLKGGRVEMAADSGLWNGNGFCGLLRNGEKIMDLGTCLVGFAGNMDGIMLIRKDIESVDLGADGGFEWSAETLGLFLAEQEYPDSAGTGEVEILVAEPRVMYRDLKTVDKLSWENVAKGATLYEVSVSGSVRETDREGCAAIGNSEMALGALILGSAVDYRISWALEIQADNGDWCRRPLHVKSLSARTEKYNSHSPVSSAAPDQ